MMKRREKCGRCKKPARRIVGGQWICGHIYCHQWAVRKYLRKKKPEGVQLNVGTMAAVNSLY